MQIIIFLTRRQESTSPGPESSRPLLAPGDVPLPAGVSVPTGTQGEVPAQELSGTSLNWSFTIVWVPIVHATGGIQVKEKPALPFHILPPW